MKSFKYYFNLNEKIIDAIKNGNSYVEIYENPDYNDWKAIEPWSRGIISKDGDLYIVSGSINLIHENIAEALHLRKLIHTDKILDPEGYVLRDVDLVMIQMKGNTKELYLSESYKLSFGVIQIFDDDVIHKLFKKCESKNPIIEFNKERIP